MITLFRKKKCIGDKTSDDILVKTLATSQEQTVLASHESEVALKPREHR